MKISYCGASGHLALGVWVLLAAVGGAVVGVLGAARIAQVRNMQSGEASVADTKRNAPVTLLTVTEHRNVLQLVTRDPPGRDPGFSDQRVRRFTRRA